MARQTTRSRKHEREVALPPPAQKKLLKLPTAQETFRRDHNSKRIGIPSVQRPVREATTAQNPPPKAKATVSAAGIFKKKPTGAINSKKQRRHRDRTPEPTPEFDLAVDLRDGVEEARAAIDTNLRASFTNVHDAFLAKLAISRTRDEAFFESISAAAAILGAPLAEEQIETTFTRDGKRVTEIVEIGKKISQFKKSVEKEEAKLKDLWKQWEDMQNDFIELGMEVFGEEAFTEDEAKEKTMEKGFKMEMQLLNLEHNSRVEELTEEVEDIAEQTLQKMRVSEKELDVTTRKQQARLLQALIQD